MNKESAKVPNLPNKDMDDTQHFWEIRSAKYDKLFWVKDDSYIQDILKFSDLQKNHNVLDVGTGTGVMAKSMKPLVDHVVAVDVSGAMLSKGQWEGISVINWDIGKAFFKDAIFDRVIARMIFHHIIDHLDQAILRCYDLLKPGGKLIVAEGVPPADDPEVVEWYTEMFKYKEERRTFIPSELEFYLKKNGFQDVRIHEHSMDKFSINNWLDNSGIDEKNKNIIIEMHRSAPQKVKDLYDMRIEGDEILVKTKNIIITGSK
jgi:SAM-dependent methyltransferase